jgi:hypothetical protein
MIARMLLPALVLSSLGAHGAAPASSVEGELRAQTQELLDAIAPGKVDVWRRLLHERMIHVDESGIVRNKEELLKELQPLPPGLQGSLRVGSFHTQVHGDTAVVTHEDHETLDYFGQILNTRFRATDTWLKTSDGWRLIATQVLAVLEDPPAIALDKQQLCAFEGVFQLTPAVKTTIRCEEGQLVSERTGRKAAVYRPETADVFFSPGQPRTRRIFQRDASGTVVRFVDRREGRDIVWKKLR